MSVYSDDYDSVTGDDRPRWIPESVRRFGGALLFLGLVGMMALWAYRLGTRDAGEVPIIRAMEGPSRFQPEDPGGSTAAHQGLEVNAVLAGRPAPEDAAAAQLAPQPGALVAEDGPQGMLEIATPAPRDAGLDAAMELQMPVADDPLAATPDPEPTPGSLAEGFLVEDPAAPDAEADAMAAAVAAAVAAVAAETPPAEAAAAAGPAPRSRPANLRPARPAAAPAATAAAAPAPAPTAAAPAAREASALPAGTRLVQLGAFDSEAVAREAWGRLAARYPDLLADKSLYVERTTANARVFYRLRVAGFSNTDQTRAMCEALRARGVDCIPVTLQ
jgi:cell division septation protein DedD